MAAYISFQPSDFYNTKLYTGNGTTNALTGVGFQPDMVWAKDRDGTEAWNQFDSVRGVLNRIQSNSNGIQSSQTDSLTAFGADGFTVGGTTANNDAINKNATDFGSWCWKMGTTSGLSGGTITPSAYSISTTAGQSIIAYTGNGSAGATIPHGLGVVPNMVIVKKLSTTGDWWKYHSSMDTTPQDYHIVVNSTAAKVNNNGEWYDTAPTSTLVTLGANTTANTVTYIAYCFADVKGYSQFGSYVGNANANGPFVYTGFRPAFVTIKNANAVQAWNTFDDKRSTSTKNTTNFLLQPNAVAAETTGVDGTKTIDLL